jgi:hypothetical protein
MMQAESKREGRELRLKKVRRLYRTRKTRNFGPWSLEDSCNTCHSCQGLRILTPLLSRAEDLEKKYLFMNTHSYLRKMEE